MAKILLHSFYTGVSPYLKGLFSKAIIGNKNSQFVLKNHYQFIGISSAIKR